MGIFLCTCLLFVFIPSVDLNQTSKYTNDISLSKTTRTQQVARVAMSLTPLSNISHAINHEGCSCQCNVKLLHIISRRKSVFVFTCTTPCSWENYITIQFWSLFFFGSVFRRIIAIYRRLYRLTYRFTL